jgi:hypothetical protein
LAQGIVRDPLQRLHVCEQHHPVGRPAAFGSNGRFRASQGEIVIVRNWPISVKWLPDALPSSFDWAIPT